MNILWFLLVGLFVGWLAGVMVRGRGYGIVVDIIVGILGAMLGGFMFGLLGFHDTSAAGSLLTALIGAFALLAIVKAIHKSA